MKQPENQQAAEHLPQSALFKYLDGETLPEAVDRHLRDCGRCSELFHLLRIAQEISGRKTPGRTDCHPSTLDLSDYIIKIYDKSLSKQEAANYVKHLQSCPLCFHYTVAQFDDALAPIPETTIQELEAFSAISLADKVLARQGAAKPAPGFLKKVSEILEKIGDYIVGKLESVAAQIPVPSGVSTAAVQTVVAATLIMLIMGGGILLYWQMRPSFLAQLRFDDKVPYEFTLADLPVKFQRTTFRGEGNSKPESPAETFVKQFQFAIRDYSLHEYEKAIIRLAAMAPLAMTLQSDAKDNDDLQLLRDFNFVLGASHVALSRSKQTNVSQEAGIRHNGKAIEYLKQALALVEQNGLDDANRENYFLGLAYGFGGQNEQAIEYLRMVQPESVHYENSTKLIESWSK